MFACRQSDVPEFAAFLDELSEFLLDAVEMLVRESGGFGDGNGRKPLDDAFLKNFAVDGGECGVALEGGDGGIQSGKPELHVDLKGDSHMWGRQIFHL